MHKSQANSVGACLAGVVFYRTTPWPASFVARRDALREIEHIKTAKAHRAVAESPTALADIPNPMRRILKNTLTVAKRIERSGRICSDKEFARILKEEFWLEGERQATQLSPREFFQNLARDRTFSLNGTWATAKRFKEGLEAADEEIRTAEMIRDAANEISKKKAEVNKTATNGMAEKKEEERKKENADELAKKNKAVKVKPHKKKGTM